MGREAPKELREPLRSFIEGESESWCMKGEGSAMLLRVAGTSTELSVPASMPGTGKLEPKLEPTAWLLDLCWLVWAGVASTPKSESSKAGMMIVV